MRTSYLFFFSMVILTAPSLWASSSATSEGTCTTSGSIKRIFVKNREELPTFVAQNYDRLQEAAARGSGPILNDYVTLLGCRNDGNIIGKAIQQNFQGLFTGKAELVKRTTDLIEGNTELAFACESRS